MNMTFIRKTFDVMAKTSEIYNEISTLNDGELNELLSKLYRNNVLNGIIVSNGDYSEKSFNSYVSISKKVEEGYKKLNVEEMRDLFGITKQGVYTVFGKSSDETYNVKDFPIFFKSPYVYKHYEIFKDKECLKLLVKCLCVLNNRIKFHGIGISKSSFYKYKEGIIKYLVKLGYLKKWHVELKDNVPFISLKFMIYGEIVQFHQPYNKWYDKNLLPSMSEDREPFTVEEEDLYAFMKNETVEQYVKYVAYAYNRYCKFLKNF